MKIPPLSKLCMSEQSGLKPIADTRASSKTYFQINSLIVVRFNDALINNAGVASMNHFMLTPLETAKRLMNTNFFGPFAAIRAFIALLKKSEHPRIVNFSTVAVPFNLDGELAYVSSKAAVEELTKILAKELSGFKITVNAVGPTPVKTALTAKVPENKIQALLDRQAIKRFGEFEDIRNVINFYLQPESDFITGQIVYLGGVNK